MIRLSWIVAGLSVWVLAVRTLPGEANGNLGPLAGADTNSPAYEHRTQHDPDGIGKFYLGREIAHVMGHAGADWLERPERVAEENPDELVRLLKLKPGMVVADIGAGTGYLSRRLARQVAPTGLVYANDVQPEMLEVLRAKAAREGLDNIRPVLGEVQDPKLPKGAVDLAILVDVYHEFSHPREMLSAIYSALKPNGRLVFVEYRGEDPAVPIKPLHKMTEPQVRREAEVFPFVWVETIRALPRQNVIVFRKSAPASPR